MKHPTYGFAIPTSPLVNVQLCVPSVAVKGAIAGVAPLLKKLGAVKEKEKLLTGPFSAV